jgi:hypothetical protein
MLRPRRLTCSKSAHDYLDDAEDLLPVRQYLFHLLLSFLKQFRSPGSLRFAIWAAATGRSGNRSAGWLAIFG